MEFRVEVDLLQASSKGLGKGLPGSLRVVERIL